ncbi:MAG: IS256 family transposase [bacterium]|jgi:putative transposase
MQVYHREATQSTVDRNLPFPIQELTMRDLQQAVKGRFSSFCTAVGIQALMTLMDQDVEAMAGPKGKHDPNRTAYRHGYQNTTVPMGNQRLGIKRPRARSIETDTDLPIPSYEAFANDDELLEAALNRMLYGMSSRDYRHGIEDYSDIAETSGTSKSAISQRFIKASAKEAQKVLGRRFDQETIPVLMIDGIALGDYTAIVAMGVTSDGHKIIMGVRIGSTENAQVCRDLLTDLVSRGLKYEQGLLAVIDGSKALRKALKDVLGQQVLIQRCQVHKMRNIIDYLPKHKRDWVKRKLKKAWTSETAEEAIRQLRSLATSLQTQYPDAAASLREGLEETVTILKLSIPGLLQRSLRSTNTIESAFSMVSKNIRNVKNWKNGTMVQRWVCAALLDAENRANRIAGYRSMGILISEIQRLTTIDDVDHVGNESKTA